MIDEMSPGVLRERARKRQRLALILGIAVLGFIPGFYVGYTDAESLFDASTDWPPAFSAALAATFLIAVVAGGWLLSRRTDEHQRMVAYKAVAAGAGVYMVAYPTWFILWKGAFLPEPMHGALFLIFYVVIAGGMLYYRFKQ